MRSLLIAHQSGRTTNKTEFVATGGIGVQTCYRRACGSAAGHWGSGSVALAISLRRCRAATYTSSVVPRFTDMLLSPFPFGSRLVVRLGVICPELRPTLLAILSVRDTAHSFPAPGSSDRLASAIRLLRSVYAVPRSEVGLVVPALHVRTRFPLRATSACPPLPHVIGPTVSEYYERI